MAFLNDITLGQYYPGEAIFHRLDPRSKLVGTTLITIGLLISSKLSLILIQSAVILAAIWVSRIPFMVIARNLKWFGWLFLITVAIHVLEIAIVGSFPFLSFGIRSAGWLNGAIYSLRLGLLIVIASLLTLTTSPIELTDSLERIFSPLKRLRIPVHELALMMTLSLRFIPILIREAERIKNAQLSRGASLEGNILQRIHNIVPMILPLFISAIRRADDLAVAMTARNYIGGEGRTCYRRLAFGPGDFLLILLSFVWVFGTMLLR